ncbi:hypothetical protein [Streptomyces sp. NPDC088923]|uniref:hypothetical protein n=1 Tax=Streptomyces sp. NPDC088923 TaxID=3365913 RepID=UPI00382D1730
MTTRRFTPAALEAIGVPFELDGDGCAAEIRDRVIGSERWTHVHELIFRAPDDGKAYLVHYEVGATEHQDGIDPWHRHGATVKAVEVVERHALVTRWAPVTDEVGPAGVLGEIAAERSAQNARWAPHDLTDGTGSKSQALDVESARRQRDDLLGIGYGTWVDALGVQVAKAAAERDPQRLRAELVRVAAVATAWIDAIDRRSCTADHPTEETIR